MKKIVGLLVVLVIFGITFLVVANGNRTQVSAASETVQTSSVAEPPAPQAPAEPASVQTATPSESIAQAAIKKASEEHKYLFLFVSESDNDETATAKRAVEAAAAKIGDKAELAFIKRDSVAEKDTVEKLQLNRAPMPIVLALAPNGAITGAFLGEKLKDPQLQDSIAGVGEQQCMKALQDQKLVFLCLQNTATTSNDTAMQGVNDFKADTRFAQFTEAITIDPAEESAQSFLAKLKLDPKMTEATTVFLAPPGSILKTITGATSKDALVATLMAASSGGCGAGGCGPKGCGPKR